MTGNIPSAMRNGKTRHKLNKMRNLLLLASAKCVQGSVSLPHYRTLPHNRRILMATMYGHFAVYESLNSCTRAHFCCGLQVGSLISAFRFSPSHILKIRRHLVIFHVIIINNIVNTGYGAKGELHVAWHRAQVCNQPRNIAIRKYCFHHCGCRSVCHGVSIGYCSSLKTRLII